MNILFVCTANISRSYFAEMLFRNEAKQNALDYIAISSAGTHAHDGNPPDPKMVDYLAEMGVLVKAHKAKCITKDLLDWADHIFVMEKAHLEIIERQFPEVKDKIDLLGRYMSDDQLVDDIIDPYGRSLFHYRLAHSQISMAIRNLIKKFLIDQNAQDKNHSD
jgi:protein-tyrosine-phosphatase